MKATVTSKGQVTIPAEIRKKMNIGIGSQLDFILNDNQHLEVYPVDRSVKRLKGMLPKPRKRLSIADMQKAIECGAHEE